MHVRGKYESGASKDVMTIGAQKNRGGPMFYLKKDTSHLDKRRLEEVHHGNKRNITSQRIRQLSRTSPSEDALIVGM